jgi:hypothetical protein
MNKVNKKDEFVRRAIWEIYNSRCFYTGKPLDYADLELDHIIPESYKNRKDDLKRVIEECGLPDDFELDSLFNLVPTNKYENRRKSDKELSVSTKLYYLGLVRGNVCPIEKRIEELKKLRNFYKNISMVKTHIDEEKNEKKREVIIENIINFVSDEDIDFDEVEKIYNIDNESIFKKYVKRIGLEAIMPKYNNTETRCIIYFRTLKVRDCMVLLDNKTILTELFSGLYTDPKYGTREFIEFEKRSEENEDTRNLDNAVIHIGNNKLKLSSEDIYTFCEVIDSYAYKYIEFISKIEDILKIHKFPLSRRRNNYKLITVTNNQWRQLVDFASRHDVDKGNSQWHIFDRNGFYIKVYTDKKHNKYDAGYHAFFNSEFDEDIVLYSESAVKDIIITWEFVEDLNKRGIDCICERQNWNAEIAYRWLVDEFMTKVLAKWNRLSFFKKKRNVMDEFFRNSKFEFINYLKEKIVKSIEDLEEIVTQLQLHYYSHPHNRYRISKNDFEGVFNSILMCINKSEKVDLHYVCEKLRFHQCKTNNELIEAIETDIKNIKEKTVRGFDIDILFRVLIIILKEKKISITEEDIKSVRENINYFIVIHDREVLLEKYAIDFVTG